RSRTRVTSWLGLRAFSFALIAPHPASRVICWVAGLPSVLRDQLADGRKEIARDPHDRHAGRPEGRFVFSGSVFLGLRLVVRQDLLDSLFVPTRRKAGLGCKPLPSTSVSGHGTISSC